MHALSLTLLVFVGLAAIGLLYEFAAEQRRAQLQARYKRQLEQMKTPPPPFRSDVRPHQGR